MERVLKKIVNIIYIIGILFIFSIEIVQFYEWFENKNSDWYMLFIIIISFYSTCIMIGKIIKSRDFLESIRSIIYNKNMDSKTKLQALDYQMYDINAYLNDK